MNTGTALIILATFGIVGAIIYNAPPPKPDTTVVVPTDNPSVIVKKIFTHDGCTGYEAYGSALGQAIYYVRCEGSNTVNTNWAQHVGKHIKYRQVETVSE